MKLLKKALALGCVLAMAAAMFTGCDNGGGGSSTPKDETPKEEEKDPDKDKEDGEDPDNNGGKDEELDISAFSEISVKTPPTITAYTLVNVDKVAFDSTGLVVIADNETVIPNNKLTFSDITANTKEVTITCGELTTKQAVKVSTEAYNATIGATDNSTGFWGASSKDFALPKGNKLVAKFVNYSDGAENWHNFLVILRTKEDNDNSAEGYQTEYAVVRADNWAWGAGYGNDGGDSPFMLDGITKGMEDARDWSKFVEAMKNGATVTAEIANYGKTANIDCTIAGTSATFTQYYHGIHVDTVEGGSADDFEVAFSLEKAHLIFGTGSPAEAGDTATSQD
ncbi:MAG: hypothetical protein J1D88_05395 [Treponema sp.]|nr:hypothetical protein [Treponema sp.]